VKLIVGADHAGFQYKQKVVDYLRDEGHEVEDVGTDSEESCDYPEYAHRVAERVSRDDDVRGILLCGSGAGMVMTANRYSGVRASLCLNEAMARKTRSHNDANCLVIGERITEEADLISIIDGFMEEEFDGGRHQRRIDKIDDPPLRVISHPLVQTKMTLLRNKETPNKKFRELVGELAGLMFYELTESFETADETVETPLGTAEGKKLMQDILLVPIMRAGLGMVEPIQQLVPNAKVGHIGLYRDEETLEPVQYYLKMPQDLQDPGINILDPMLATGGTATATISMLKDEGFDENLRFLCLVAAPEGIERVHDNHPDVAIHTAAIDDGLDDDGYIMPGLGDAGDRLFGTQ
jgi:uracil phosphoribosyltransferase